MLVAHGADVNGLAKAEGVHRHGGASGVKVLHIRRQNLAALRLDDVAPELCGVHMAGRESTFESKVIFLAGRNGVEFQNFQTEHFRQIIRITGVRGDVVLVDEAGVAGADERATVLDVKLQAVGFGGGKQMERWGDDELVLGEILGGPREIHLQVASVQCAVKKPDVLVQVEKLVWLVGLLQRPVIVMAVEDANVGDDLGALDDRREQFYLLADLADFLEHAGVAFDVLGQNRTVEFLTADPGLPPAEIKDAGRAPGKKLVGEQPDQAGPHERVDFRPVGLPGFLFHRPKADVPVRGLDVRLLERTQHVHIAG